MIHLRPMTVSDLPLGMRLKEQAGWNQTDADWQRCLTLQPDGCFVAECDGVPVGTVTTSIFGPIAWIAMVLVDVSFRGQGIGRALLDRALTFLDGRGVPSVRLDATPLGRPLYEKLGFVEEYTLTRYEGISPVSRPLADSPNKIALRDVRPKDLERVIAFDQDVTGTDRTALLRSLFAEMPEAFRTAVRGEEWLGYSAARVGSRARQIGPCLATVEAGPLLVADAWRSYPGEKVFVDVPKDNHAAVATVEEVGFVPQRPLYRMCRGPRPYERIEQLWASFGPEKG
jgi:ribosomal protein S18 acetylase RimI-like enzyme